MNLDITTEIQNLEITTEIQDIVGDNFNADMIVIEILNAGYGPTVTVADIGVELWDYIAATANITAVDAIATILTERMWGESDGTSVGRMTIAMEYLGLTMEAAHDTLVD
jgi:hypothetical protein